MRQLASRVPLMSRRWHDCAAAIKTKHQRSKCAAFKGFKCSVTTGLRVKCSCDSKKFAVCGEKHEADSLYSCPMVCMRVWMSDNYIACCWWMSSIIYIFICMIADYRSHCFLVLWVAPICVCSSSVCVCVCTFRRQRWWCPRWGAAGSADSPAGTDGLPHAPGCAWPQPAGGHGARAGLAEA